MISALTFWHSQKYQLLQESYSISLHEPVQKTCQKNVNFLERRGGRDSLPRVLRAGATGLQTLNIARCCCQASSLEGLWESQRNVEGHVLSNNRRKEIEVRTGEREVEQREGSGAEERIEALLQYFQ